jgi:hypothetical protein
MTGAATLWPTLDYPQWRDTALTLQLWTQIVGKVRLALSPWVNHGWQVPLYVSARGLATGPIPAGGELLEIEFDFLDHSLACRSSSGEAHAFPLRPRSVADFYRELMESLADMGVSVTIDRAPNEMPTRIRFDRDDLHASYDAAAVRRFWRALVTVEPILRQFRTAFLGKVSPVHFFWGSFDLAVTRFSGRRAPLHPGGVPGLPDRVTREAYSHEVSSAGFWPGNDAFPEAAFYSYAWPEPPGFREAAVPAPARFDASLQEYILPWEAVRTAEDPEALLLEFLAATYAAAADLGGWDRNALECAPGVPGIPRSVE